MAVRVILAVLLLAILAEFVVRSCLITNCPRGGKRSGKMIGMQENNIKRCISCGPGKMGQCFGPNICCGPFGCLMGTPETMRCERDGSFHEPEPCMAGTSTCRKNTGVCATDGICCTQESCHSDRSCLMVPPTADKQEQGISPMDLYNIINYQTEYAVDN